MQGYVADYTFDSVLTLRCRILIASIMEEYNKDAWEELIERCEETGVDAFEINFSCPHGMPERKMGMAMGQDCDLLEVSAHAIQSLRQFLLCAAKNGRLSTSYEREATKLQSHHAISLRHRHIS